MTWKEFNGSFKEFWKALLNPPKDPLKHCKLYKAEGCAHVDGFLCDVDTCQERLLHEIFLDEQILDIPFKDRLYKTRPDLYKHNLRWGKSEGAMFEA